MGECLVPNFLDYKFRTRVCLVYDEYYFQKRITVMVENQNNFCLSKIDQGIYQNFQTRSQDYQQKNDEIYFHGYYIYHGLWLSILVNSACLCGYGYIR